MEQKYELYHHGILGQKWGIRRFQNADGSLTSAGRKRYDSEGIAQKVKNGVKNFGTSKVVKGYAGKGDVGKIVAKTVVGDAALVAAGGTAAAVLSMYGHEGLSAVVAMFGNAGIAALSAVGITAAIQRGRGKI